MAKHTFLRQAKLALSEPLARVAHATGYAINAINAKSPTPGSPSGYEINEINEISPLAEARERLVAARAACLAELDINRAAALGRALADFDAAPVAIDPGYWHLGEPPEAPPAPDDGPSAEYWGWPPLALDAWQAADVYQRGECSPGPFWARRLETSVLPGCRAPLFHGVTGYLPAPSPEQSLARLEARLDWYRRMAEDADDDPTASQDRRDYLRGPHGEHDRATIWRGGLGILSGTGEGGLWIGWQPPSAVEVAEWLRAGTAPND